MDTKKQWYLVQTKPERENRVVSSLLKKEIECYCPLIQSGKQRKRLSKVVYEPLFKSRIFVNTSESVLPQIMQTSGIVNFVYWLSKPAVIDYNDVAAIQMFLINHSADLIDMYKTDMGSTTKIYEEMNFLKDDLVSKKGGSVVRVKLSSLGYVLVAHAEREKSDAAGQTLVKDAKNNISLSHIK